MNRLGLLTAGAVGAGAAFVAGYRPWQQRWGATDAEVAATLPGDELLHRPEFHPTRAISIAAPPEDVWPWIVQIGYGRAGFYAYDLLDNLGKPSADRVIPELQDLKIGDWIPMSPTVNDMTAFRVVALEPVQWMLWSKPDSTWCWRLEATEDRGTRLVSRIRMKYAWRSPMIPVSLFLMEVGDFFMNRRELQGIKRRAEAVAADRASAATAQVPGPTAEASAIAAAA